MTAIRRLSRSETLVKRYTGAVDLPRILFAITQAALLVCLFCRGVWRDLPVFTGYMALSLALNAFSFRPFDAYWREVWWPWQNGILLVGRFAVVLEFVSQMQSGLFRREYRAFRWMLICALALVAPAFALVLPQWSPLWKMAAVSQYLQIGFVLMALTAAGYSWARRVPVTSLVHAHGWVLCGFLVTLAAARMLEPATGICPMPRLWRPVVSHIAFLTAAGCCVLWSMLLTRSASLRVVRRAAQVP